MKLNEEAIGGREGYLQRLISSDGSGVRAGETASRVERAQSDILNGGEAGGPDRTGKRDGAPVGGYPGDSGRRTRPNNTHQLAVELLKIREP